MEALFVVLFVVVVVVVQIVRGLLVGTKAVTTAAEALGANGIPARGLVIQASQQSTGTTVGVRRAEQRMMTIDVEIPGEVPYLCTAPFVIPRGLVEPTPGTSLELAVDRTDRNNVVILGPGGFTGPWLNLGPPNPY